MKTISEDRIKTFRDRLYHKKIPQIFQKGADGLAPIKWFKRDENDQVLVPVRKIVSFFIEQVRDNHLIVPDDYISDLYTLLDLLTSKAAPFAFECGVSVSERDIHEAGIKAAIENLTQNLIITYFGRIKNDANELDTHLLEPGLKQLILESGSGRDYKTLAGETLKNLTQALAEDKPWRSHLEDINDADLVCRLVGARLPKMDNKVLSGIIQKAREELNQKNGLLEKIIDTRAYILGNEQDPKKFLKAMQKLSQAAQQTLREIDRFLFSAGHLRQATGSTFKQLLGAEHTQLKKNLARLFLVGTGEQDGGNGHSELLKELGYAGVRYRLNRVFYYKSLVLYCREFKTDPNYQTLFLDLFSLCYDELESRINAWSSGEETDTADRLGQCLNEIRTAIDNLNLEEQDLLEEKQRVREAYIRLVKKATYETLEPVMALKADVGLATQDRTMELTASLRRILHQSCFEELCRYSERPMTGVDVQKDIKKRLHSYALYYKPQRAFYSTFFNHHICPGERLFAPGFNDLINKNKYFAKTLLGVFADYQFMSGFMDKEYIIHAQSLTDKIA